VHRKLPLPSMEPEGGPAQLLEPQSKLTSGAILKQPPLRDSYPLGQVQLQSGFSVPPFRHVLGQVEVVVVVVVVLGPDGHTPSFRGLGDPTAAGSAGRAILQVFVNGGTPSNQRNEVRRLGALLGDVA